jgi:phosphoribosylglycinamide formyltransferase-1
MSLPRIIIFASGNGSNAVNIIQYFNEKKNALVPAVFYNKKDAGVVDRVKDKNIDLHYFNRTDFYDTENVIEAVRKHKPDLIVLAGFLWLVPASFIKAFENKIINLLPYYQNMEAKVCMVILYMKQSLIQVIEKAASPSTR